MSADNTQEDAFSNSAERDSILDTGLCYFIAFELQSVLMRRADTSASGDSSSEACLPESSERPCDRPSRGLSSTGSSGVRATTSSADSGLMFDVRLSRSNSQFLLNINECFP
jgi:hypothetical protein